MLHPHLTLYLCTQIYVFVSNRFCTTQYNLTSNRFCCTKIKLLCDTQYYNHMVRHKSQTHKKYVNINTICIVHNITSTW